MFALLGSLLLLAATAVAEPPGAPFSPECLVGQPNTYDASQASKIPWYSVNLDSAPIDRFKRIASDHADQIREGVDVIRRMLDGLFGPLAMKVIEHLMETAHETRLAQPYKDEITGMAQASGVPVAHLTMMNMFYELSRFCTSIIAQSPTGQMFHARNLDFGQLFWWNTTSRSWGMTDKLKPLTINLMFLKNNRLVYKGTGFAGHVGVITAMKPNAFTLSMNARVHPDIGNLFEWFTGNFSDAHFAMWLDREVMEQANTYDDARDFLKKAPLMTGSYYILGGSQPGQGTVITRDPSSVINERFLQPNDANGWFLLQTNYDPGENTIFLDDRRGPGTACMIELGQNGVSAAGLFQVLKSKTTLNKTTVHTVIMSITTGLYQTFIQYCPDPCWFL